MRTRAVWLGIIGLVGGTVVIANGCDSGSASRRDAGTSSDVASLDVPLTSGGTSGTGGALGGGGTVTSGGGGGSAGGRVGGGGSATSGGAGGSAGAGMAGTTVTGAGGSGIAGGAGGRGGTAGAGTGGTTAGAGGARLDGSAGTDGAGTGGTPSTDGAATGGASGFDAAATSTYSGCTYIGGIDRAVVAKFDPQAGTCVAIVLFEPSRGSDAGLGLTITQGWGLESVSLWTSTTGQCAQRMAPAGRVSATSASGSVSINASASTIDVDAVLGFPATDAEAPRSVELKATGVDMNHGCSN